MPRHHSALTAPLAAEHISGFRDIAGRVDPIQPQPYLLPSGEKDRHELLESGAHEPPQRPQELFHRRGIDPESGDTSNLAYRAEEPHFSHEEQRLGARVYG